MKLQTLDALTASGTKFLILSKSGGGKTQLGSTLPGKTIYVSLENGLNTLRKIREKRKDVFYYDCTKDDDDNPVPDELRPERFNQALQLAIQSDAKNIIIDSFTELGEVIHKALKVVHPGNNQNYEVYRVLAEKLISCAKMLRDVPNKNVVILALESYERDENGALMVLPDIPGKKTAPKLPALFDEVYTLHAQEDEKTGKIKRFLQTDDTKSHFGKSRSGLLDLYEPADLGHILKKIHS